MLNRIINNEGSGTGEWTLLSRIIWLKATVLAAAGAAWHTVTGAIVQFVTERAHALKQVVVDVNPVQDLHGYDAPWPGGGMGNLADPSTFTLNNVTENNGVYTASDNDTASSLVFKIQQYNGSSFISGTQTQTAAITTAQQIRLAVIIDASATRLKFANNGAVSEFALFIPLESNLAGQTVTFSADITDVTVGSCKFKNIQLEIGNIASPVYYPYSNVCPISGWTEANVTRTGKNLFDSDKLLSVTGWTKSDNVYTGRCDYLEHYVFFQNNGYDGQFTVSVDHLGQYAYRSGYIAIYYTDGTSSSVSLDGDTWKHFTVTSTIGKTVNRIAYLKSNNQIISLKNFQIEISVSETDYEAYQGNIYAIDWTDEAGTVYRGKLTVKEDGSAEVKGTHKKDVVTSTTSKSWGTSASGKGMFTVKFNDAKIDGIPSEQLLSNIFTANNTRGGAGNIDYQMTTYSSTADDKWIKFIGPWADLNAANAWLDTVTLEVLYPLATPITYTLTAQQVISALQGYNAMWADTGDVTVTFRGTPIVEPDEQPLQALNLLLGGAYRNNQTQDDVSDEEALDILLGGENR